MKTNRSSCYLYVICSQISNENKSVGVITDYFTNLSFISVAWHWRRNEVGTEAVIPCVPPPSCCDTGPWLGEHLRCRTELRFALELPLLIGCRMCSVHSIHVIVELQCMMRAVWWDQLLAGWGSETVQQTSLHSSRLLLLLQMLPSLNPLSFLYNVVHVHWSGCRAQFCRSGLLCIKQRHLCGTWIYPLHL